MSKVKAMLEKHYGGSVMDSLVAPVVGFTLLFGGLPLFVEGPPVAFWIMAWFVATVIRVAGFFIVRNSGTREAGLNKS